MRVRSGRTRRRDHGKNLAEELSARRSRRSRLHAEQIGGRPGGQESRGVQRPPGFPLHGQDHQLRRSRPDDARFRRLAAFEGLRQGRAGGDHDAQLPAVSGRALRHPARGRNRGERQSALYPPGTGAPVKGRGRGSDRDPGELRHHAAGSAAEDVGEACGPRLAGRPARPQGPDREFLGAQRKEAGAGVQPARCLALQRHTRRGRRQGAEAGRGRPRRHRFASVHRRHHRCVERRDAAPPQHPRQHRADVRMAASGSQGRGRGDRHRAAALSHFLFDGELPADDEMGRLQHPDHQPARHSRLRQGARQAPLQHDHRREHPVQRTGQRFRIRPARFLFAEAAARSDCRCHPPRSRSATTTGRMSNGASRGRSASAARR